MRNITNYCLLLLALLLSSSLLAQEITLKPIGTYRDGAFDEGAAEIVSYDPVSKRLFLTNGSDKTVDVLDISNPNTPTLINSIDITPYGGGANSVDVANGKVAVAVEANIATDPGKVILFDIDGKFLQSYPAGVLPDALAFSPDGNTIVVANEGEPNDDYTIDPEGSVTIVRLDRGRRVQQVNFRRFNHFKLLLQLKGVRIFGPKASVAQDLEPESVAISPDNRTAYVSLQENNAYAIIDLMRGKVKKIIPFGYKNHNQFGNGIDASNRDGSINIDTWPVLGMYQPDALATYEKYGQTFIVTANEGDARDYDGFSEEARVADLTLNPKRFPNADELQLEDNLGRLNTTTTQGFRLFGKSSYEFIFSYGARSFSIWNAKKGRQIYDSGDDFEQITSERLPADFNSNNDENGSFDARSDDKGPEPEAITIGHLGGRDYAFIGLERIGGIMVYDITDPSSPYFIDYINNRNFEVDAETAEAGDLGVEDLRFVAPESSPNGRPLLIAGNEVSGTVTIFEIGTPAPLVRFTHIDNANEIVTLKNFGNNVVDISGLFLCKGPGKYAPLTSYSDISEGTMLEAGEELMIDLSTGTGNVTDLNNIVGQLALFANNNFTSTSPFDFLDYIQFGGVLLEGSRAEQATTAGRWSDPQDFATQANPWTWTGDGDDVGADFWQGSGLLTSLSEDFNESCPEGLPSGWTLFETGANLATCGDDVDITDSPFIEFSGFSAGAGTSYFISPMLDLTAADFVLNFDYINQFGGPEAQVLISTDYAGGDPTAATFTKIFDIGIPGLDDEFTASGDIALPSETQVSIAFLYESLGPGPGNSTRLRIDNIKVIETPVIFFEDFNAACETNDIPEGWVEFNESDNDLINCVTVDGDPFLDFNGFGVGAGVAWAISPLVDFSNAELFLNLEYVNQFGGPDPMVLYSTDYSGSGDPNLATWTDFTEATQTLSTSTGGSVVPVSIPASFIGTQAYLAFKYTSEGSSGGQSLRFRINDVGISKPIPVQPAGVLAIYEIQGEDLETGESPFAGQGVSTSGVITAIFDGNEPYAGAGYDANLGGFFLQDVEGDENDATSDGIFVAASAEGLSVGDFVTLDALIAEQFDQTTLTEVENIVVQSSGVALPEPVAIGSLALESLEGMLVSAGSATVMENRNVDNFGEIRIGTERFFQPTQIIDPNDADPTGNTSSGGSNEAALTAYLDQIAKGSLLLDDGRNGSPAVEFPYIDPSTNSLPTGSTVRNVVGALGFGFSEYRIQPTQAPAFVYAERPAEVPSVNGETSQGQLREARLKVAAFNVLNYFNGNGDGTGFPTSRGADTFEEFVKQRDKIVEAIKVLDADVVGLMEIENDEGEKNALADLVAALNASIGSEIYAAVETGKVLPATADPDEIRVAMIYRPAAVSLKGDFAILTSAENELYDDDKNRPAIAQTFVENGTDEVFTVVVNHFKSKGSGCGTGDDDPFQGNCNGTRTNAAIAQAEWLATDPTGSEDPDFLIIGDINAYAQEDPMDAFRAAGYVNLEPDTEYSFVFDGLAGSLDHALAINGMTAQITGSTTWHINADEPDYFAYDGDEDFFVADPFRSSDHDAIVVGLRLDRTNVTPPPPVGGDVIVRRINSSTDDAEQYLPGGSRPDNGMDITSSDIELGQETGPDDPNFDETFQLSGLRFTNIEIPQNSIISNAYITFTVDATDKNFDPAEFYIIAENSSDPFTYTDSDENITSRTYLKDTVAWFFAGGWENTGDLEKTPNIAPLIQKLVSRPDWSGNGSIAIVIGGSGIREAESWDGSANDAAEITIAYTPTTSNEFPILASTDDAEQYLPGGTRDANDMDIESSDLELGQESKDGDFGGPATFQLTGLRFANVEIPNGALISEAYIQFTVDNISKNLDPSELYIVVEDSDSTSTYQDVLSDITDRTYYSSETMMDTVQWNIPAGTWNEIGQAGAEQRSANIGKLLQYVVNKEGWQEGNAVSFVIGGSGIREAESFDNDEGDGTLAPKLVVNWVPVVGDEVQIAASDDDAEQYLPGGSRPDNGMDITSSDIELGQESAVGSEFGETFQLSGLRFRNIDVPAGAIIESASIQFTVDNFNKNVDPTELSIRVENTANANPYIDIDGNISSRNYFEETVDWMIPAETWTTIGESGPDQETPDISRLLQAAVNRPDWKAGNAVAFVLDGFGIREAASFDGSPEDAAILKYTFAKGDPEPVVPEILAEIEDVETTVNTSFSVNLNDFFIDENSRLFFTATTEAGEALPESITLDFEEGVLRGFLPEPSSVDIKVVAESLGDTISQTFKVTALPRIAPDVFTLELLHVTDQEAGAPAIQDAPRLSAVMNALEAEDLGGDGVEDNTLRLSSGDAFIPGLFYDASGDAFGSRGVADIQIQNELGFKAIAFGNHEFDFGTETLAGLISGATAAPAVFDLPGTDLAGGVPFAGANFPYLSSNLNFSFTENLGALEVAGSQSPQKGKVTSSTIVEVNGESIGVVGATTPILASISSPDDVGVLPAQFANAPTYAEIDELAELIQSEVDVLLALNPTVDKIILLAHMQRLDIEFALAQKLVNVDIIVGGGSNTRLLDADDRLRDGDTKQGDYPSFFTNAGGSTTAVVNTDGSYKYVGRLVIDFDAEGNIVPESYDVSISGAYATDEQGVTDLNATALVDPEVEAIAAAIQEAIIAKESNVFGVASTYLNGNRAGAGTGDDPDGVRTQETNLGNLTADANLVAARAVEPDVLVSIKNGGGIRASIGQIVVPVGGTEAVRLPNEEILDNSGNVVKPAGGISENDINTTLAFNNGLTLLTLTAAELKAVLEHGVALSPTSAGQFIQVGGINFSFDPSLSAGSRIQNAIFVDENGAETGRFITDGELDDDAPESVRIVTLNFLAGGGDDYPFPDGPAANRVDLFADGVNDGATGDATFADEGTEQDALAEYLLSNFTVDTPFDSEDLGPVADNRIQNLAFRADGLVGTGDAAARLQNSGRELERKLTNGDLKVYPNPLQSTLNVEFPTSISGEVEVTIREIASGRELSRDKIMMDSYGALQLDVSGIRTRGVYIMTLTTEDGQVVTKSLLK